MSIFCLKPSMFPITPENPMTLLKSKKPIWKNRDIQVSTRLANKERKIYHHVLSCLIFNEIEFCFYQSTFLVRERKYHWKLDFPIGISSLDLWKITFLILRTKFQYLPGAWCTGTWCSLHFCSNSKKEKEKKGQSSGWEQGSIWQTLKTDYLSSPAILGSGVRQQWPFRFRRVMWPRKLAALWSSDLGKSDIWSESLPSMDKGSIIMIENINLVSDTSVFKFQLYYLLVV